MISTTTLKEYLNIDGTGDNNFLQVCIDQATANVESFCNRQFEKSDYVEYSDGNGTGKVFIRNYPLISINLIEVRDGNVWSELTDSTAMVMLQTVNAIELTKTYLPKGKSNIKISYESGWDVDECKTDLKGVMLEMASIFYCNSPHSGKARLGIASENTSSTASERTVFKDLTSAWKDVLKRYRIGTH